MTEKRASTIWHVHTMESGSTLKKEESLTAATTWVNVDNTIGEKKSHKDKCYVGPLLWVPRVVEFSRQNMEGRLLELKGWVL